jgi:hypothetical protein
MKFDRDTKAGYKKIKHNLLNNLLHFLPPVAERYRGLFNIYLCIKKNSANSRL